MSAQNPSADKPLVNSSISPLSLAPFSNNPPPASITYCADGPLSKDAPASTDPSSPSVQVASSPAPTTHVSSQHSSAKTPLGITPLASTTYRADGPLSKDAPASTDPSSPRVQVAGSQKSNTQASQPSAQGGKIRANNIRPHAGALVNMCASIIFISAGISVISKTVCMAWRRELTSKDLYPSNWKATSKNIYQSMCKDFASAQRWLW